MIMRRQDRINTFISDELILEIFRHINSKASRDACSLVCKRWLRLERLSRTTLRIGASGRPDLFIKLLARRFVNVKNIVIEEGIYDFIAELLAVRRSQRHSVDLSSVKQHYLNEISGSQIRFESLWLSNAGLNALVKEFPKLEKLSLTSFTNLSSLELKSLAKCLYLKSLNLQYCFGGNKGLAAVGKFCKQLEDLNLRSCTYLTDTGLIDFAHGCGKSLKSLGIEDCHQITDLSLEAVGSHCKSLETLVVYSSFYYNDGEFINDKGVIAVAQGCPLLRVLKMQRINVTDKTLIAVGNCCLSLELLASYNVITYTNKGLCAVGKGCKKLKNLTLASCYYVRDMGLEAIAAGCTELTHLELNFCHNIGTMALESIAKSCQRLVELSLSHWETIGNSVLLEVGRGCKFLQALVLVNCSSIGDDGICSVAEGCKKLKKLHIHKCCEIGNKGIMAVYEYCNSLTELSLRFCDRVDDKALIAIGQHCSLQHLDVRGCHQIGDAGIIAVARGCPELNYLDVSCNENLRDRAIFELVEGCPLLKDIVLSKCCRITDVSLSHLVKKCAMLESCCLHYCVGITAAGVASLFSSASLKKIKVDKWKVYANRPRGRQVLSSHMNGWAIERRGIHKSAIYCRRLY